MVPYSLRSWSLPMRQNTRGKGALLLATIAGPEIARIADVLEVVRASMPRWHAEDRGLWPAGAPDPWDALPCARLTRHGRCHSRRACRASAAPRSRHPRSLLAAEPPQPRLIELNHIRRCLPEVLAESAGLARVECGRESRPQESHGPRADAATSPRASSGNLRR